MLPFSRQGAAVKGAVILVHGCDRAAHPIGIVVSRIGHSELGHLALGRQIGQLQREILPPPVLEFFLLIFQLILADGAVLAGTADLPRGSNKQDKGKRGGRHGRIPREIAE
jgi:hypothetical protein